jgi:hypothetical protein
MTTTTKTRYFAVAITSAGEFIPFGPGFPSEDDAWRWLHYDAALFPEHKSIDVFPIA